MKNTIIYLSTLSTEIKKIQDPQKSKGLGDNTENDCDAAQTEGGEQRVAAEARNTDQIRSVLSRIY